MDLERASWWSRAGASIIDALILVAVGFGVGILVGLGGVGSDGVVVAIYGFVFFATIFYSPVLMARPGDVNGQTVGKRAMGIRVVHTEGGPMTLGRGLMRDGVGKIVLGLIPLYTFIDVLVPLGDGNKQAIHDKVGKTLVVRTGAEAVPAGRPGPGLEAFTPPPPPPPSPSSQTDWPRSMLEPSQDAPDLGRFVPPGADPPPPPPPPLPPRADPDDDEAPRGPFGPSHD